MQEVLKNKLKTTVSLIDNIMVDPDIDVEYCIPEVAMTLDEKEIESDPYILIKYTEDSYIERKIALNDHYSDQSAEEIANYVTFSIEQFKEEVDSLKYGM